MGVAIAYYNEIDPYAAAWLRNLIKAGVIAYGHVDERSIEDVKPTDLNGYTQCHFYAGIGVWSFALRTAGWRDDRPIWTASCPCQPFSQAGEGNGFDDQRHLWPATHWLVEQCRPSVVVGEQVASSFADVWIDLVQADMEALGYAFGSIPFPSAGIGAPHIRDRNYWVADAGNGQRARQSNRELFADQSATEWHQSDSELKSYRKALRLADPNRKQYDGCGEFGPGWGSEPSNGSHLGGMADSNHTGLEGRFLLPECGYQRPAQQGGLVDSEPAAGPTNGYWDSADWLACTDGKWRPVEPGTQPLVDGSAKDLGRVRADQGHRSGRLKGYGNAINLWAAVEFIKSFKDHV